MTFPNATLISDAIHGIPIMYETEKKHVNQTIALVNKGEKMQCPNCCNQSKGPNLLQQNLQTDPKALTDPSYANQD